MAEHIRRPRRNRSCEVCAAQYNATYAAQRTCGRACGLALKRGDTEPAPAAPAPHSRVRVATCDVCAAPFVTRRGNRKRCSPECMGTAIARQAIPDAIRVQAYARDHYRCHLCQYQARTDVPHSHPWAVSLDHLVLYRDGGSNQPDNLATAHWWCNLVRYCGTVSNARAALTGMAPPDQWDSAHFQFMRDLVTGSAPRAWRDTTVARRPAEPGTRTCRECSEPMPHNGKRGRPRAWCTACRPQVQGQVTSIGKGTSMRGADYVRRAMITRDPLTATL